MRRLPWIAIMGGSLFLSAGTRAGPVGQVANLACKPTPSPEMPKFHELGPGPETDGSILPREIPGYQLKVLDTRKKLQINVEGRLLRAELPVFFYFPTPALEAAADRLSRAYDKLLDLAQKPEWTASDLREIITELAGALEAIRPPSLPVR